MGYAQLVIGPAGSGKVISHHDWNFLIFFLCTQYLNQSISALICTNCLNVGYIIITWEIAVINIFFEVFCLPIIIFDEFVCFLQPVDLLL